ncbi:hypothetical protein ACIGW0_29165 [Streptomyces bikiniensis]|uniref:Uncharacterized protein n=1 Tax=Streptomyces bikiniensis TaxID=1896 RepID=A0ABW8D0M6_STRBI
MGAIEETSDEAVRVLSDVDVSGVLDTLRATPPAPRAQRSGHVVNIGSEAAEPPLRLQSGADAAERVEAEPDLVRRELDRWRHVALSTGVAETVR